MNLEHARALLEQMRLNTAAQLLGAQLEQSFQDQQTCEQFLNERLFSKQQEHQRKSREICLKLVRPPYRKDLEDFVFVFQPSIDKRLIEKLSTLTFICSER